jgi:putative transcription factor
VYLAEIEGTSMHVCTECSRFGKTKGKTNVRVVVEEKKRKETTEPVYVFAQGYGTMVKKAREKLGLKQEEMAKKLNERESTLHNIESEHFKPSIELARKLEKSLHISIVEEIKDEQNSSTKSHQNSMYGRNSGSSATHGSNSLTLGDFVIKK